MNTLIRFLTTEFYLDPSAITSHVWDGSLVCVQVVCEEYKARKMHNYFTGSVLEEANGKFCVFLNEENFDNIFVN
jgi:hypothetical protein